MLNLFTTTVAMSNSSYQTTFIIVAKNTEEADLVLKKETKFDQYIKPIKSLSLQVARDKSSVISIYYGLKMSTVDSISDGDF